MTRAVTYARVSGDDQAKKGTSLAEQERTLRAYVAAHSFEHVQHVVDRGKSGGNLARPGMDRVREMVAAGDVDLVIATHGDRLSRNHLDSLGLMTEFGERGCAIRVITEGTDTSTLFGRFQNGLQSLVAQHWRAQAAERTKQGRLAAARDGRFVGSTPPYGYRVTGERKARRLEVDEAQAEAVRTIYERLVVGRVPAKDVASELDERGLPPARRQAWDAPTLRRWAKTESHIRAAAGVWTFAGVEVPIPAILSAEEAAVWRAWIRDAKADLPPRAPQNYMLAGMVRMPCGRGGLGRQTSGRRRTYSCRDHLDASVPGHEECRNVDADRLEATVVDVVRRQLLQPQVLRAAVAGSGPSSSPAIELVQVQAELVALTTEFAEEAAMWRQLGLEKDDAEAAVRPLLDRQRALRGRERALKKRLAEQQTGTEAKLVERSVRLLTQRIETDDPEVWRPVLQTLEVRVSVEAHVPCGTCTGTGYAAFERGAGRRAPRRCGDCLSGTVPVLDVQVADTLALAVAEGLDRASGS